MAIAKRYLPVVTGHAERPLLFLDVDGPLVPFGAGARPGDVAGSTAAAHLSRLRADMGPALAALPCTLVWATSWQAQDANTVIARRMGLPDLPAVAWPELTGAQEREDRWLGLCWKTRPLLDWAAGRPFAWVDDEITDADRDWVSANHPAPALLHHVDASAGLAGQDLADLDAWLRSYVPR